MLKKYRFEQAEKLIMFSARGGMRQPVEHQARFWWQSKDFSPEDRSEILDAVVVLMSGEGEDGER